MHLVIVQHGVWGEPSNTRFLENLLSHRLGHRGHVVNFAGNAKFATYDGIDVCGERLFEAIKSTHDQLVQQGTVPTHISFVGYSMGGLIARYAAGRLSADGYFEVVTPLNFITVATPHLGSWRAHNGPMGRLINAVSRATLARTGSQLFLEDHTAWGAPLLAVLSHPGIQFMAALRRFRNIVVLANVRHDRLVSFCSAAMQLDEPYPRGAGFNGAVVAVDPIYPSIVKPREKPGETPHPPGSSPARSLHGRFLLTLLVIGAVVLFPVVLLAALALMLHGWLHGRRAARNDPDATVDLTGAQPQAMQKQSQQQLALNPAKSSSGDIEMGVVQPGLGDPGLQPGPIVVAVGVPGTVGSPTTSSPAVVNPTDCGGGGGVASGGGGVVVPVGGREVRGSGGTVAGDDLRIPLHPGLRQHSHHPQQVHLFAGLPPYSDKKGMQEWLAAQLGTLPVRKVHVDTGNVLHAHSAIIVWNRLFLHCKDVVEYLVDRCMVWA